MKITLFAAFTLLTIGGFWIFEGDFDAAEVDAKYTSPSSQFLKLGDGTRIHFRDEGNQQGTALVLIHGSNASLHTWSAWVQELGQSYRVVSLDLPGHGLTGETQAQDYSSQYYVDTVDALVKHLGIETFVLGGNSMGGGVTWRYTLSHPNKVLGMVLVNASGLYSWYATARNDQSNSPLAFRLLRQPWFQGIARYVDAYPLVKQGLKASHYDPEMVTDALIARYYDLSMRAGTRDATLARFSQDRVASYDESDLASIVHPALVIWGAEDNVIPSSIGERFANTLSNAELIIYPEIGHVPMEEIPTQSASEVRRFLEQFSPRTGA